MWVIATNLVSLQLETNFERPIPMAITLSSSLPSSCLSSELPDVEVALTGTSLAVVISHGETDDEVDQTTIFSETLYPTDGKVTLTDLSALLQPWVRQYKHRVMEVEMTERDSSGSTLATQLWVCDLYYCRADITSHGVSEQGYSWLDSHFLTAVDGVKTTVMGRQELLWFVGELTQTDEFKVVARFADGSSATVQPQKVIETDDFYCCLDVSPQVMDVGDDVLVGYTVIAGARMQDYALSFGRHDNTPAMIFENIFGLDEVIYCDGELKTAPSYKFNSAYIEGKLTNYDIEETRTFKANTGPLDTALLPWARDFLTSPYIRLLDICGDTPVPGKEVVITEAKSESSSADDDVPAFTFSYQYAQKNQHVHETHAKGRVFDDTFDYTFA